MRGRIAVDWPRPHMAIVFPFVHSVYNHFIFSKKEKNKVRTHGERERKKTLIVIFSLAELYVVR